VKAGESAAPSVSTPAMITPAPAPADPAPLLRPIDPVQVSESADRSPALAPLSPKPADPPRARPLAFRWWVWFPWTAVAVLLTAKYLYLTQVDKTWNQRVSEVTYATGPTKVVEVPVERVVEKVVEKPVDRVMEKAVAAGDSANQIAWAAFVAEFRAQLSRGEVVPAADRLHAWMRQAVSVEPEMRAKLTELQTELRTVAAARLQEWTAGRCQDRRFADAYAGLQAFGTAESVKALLEPAAAAKALTEVRGQVRAAEDEYHYTQIRALAAADSIPEERLKQHIDAYLALVEPPARMLAEIQQLADYRKWLKDGRPGRAIVKVKWGPRTTAQRHTIEFQFGDRKDGLPVTTFTRATDASPGQPWTDAFPVTGITSSPQVVPYRLRTMRPASAVEELAEGARDRIEVFGADPPGAELEVGSGTVVRVELQGLVERPVLPAWRDAKAPVLPVSLPKVGP
jgi:hypothetical protein